MARKRAQLTGIGTAVVLAFVMAGDLRGRAELAAPASIAAKSKERAAEKATEKVAEKTPEKAPARTLATAAISIPLPRARPQPAAGAGTHAKTASLGPAAAADRLRQRPRAWISRPPIWPLSKRPSRSRAIARPARSPICRKPSPTPSPASWSNGCCCAATTTPATIPAMPPSSAPIRAGPASVCCGAGPRPWSGRSSPSRVRFARFSASSRRSAPRAVWRWRARCLPWGTVPGRKRSCATLGATRPCRAIWKSRSSTLSTTSSRRPITKSAWTCVSTWRTWMAACGRQAAPDRPRSRSARRGRR